MKRALALAVSSLVAATAAPAGADPHAEELLRAEAKVIAIRGDMQFYAGRCDRALPLWRQAEATYHAPTILLRIARCQALLGKIVEAATTLEAIAGEALRRDAPLPFVVAREEAKREIDPMRGRIAWLRIAVHAREPVPVRVEIDGTAQPDGAASFPLDPGDHWVVVHAGGSTWERSLHLRAGERLVCDVPLWTEPAPAPRRVQRDIGLAAFGVGGAALAVGIGFGIAALAGSRGLDASCGPDRTHCPPGEQAAIDRVRVHSTVADAAIGGGAALVISGAVTLVTAPPRDDGAPRIRFVASPFSLALGLSL